MIKVVKVRTPGSGDEPKTVELSHGAKAQDVIRSLRQGYGWEGTILMTPNGKVFQPQDDLFAAVQEGETLSLTTQAVAGADLRVRPVARALHVERGWTGSGREATGTFVAAGRTLEGRAQRVDGARFDYFVRLPGGKPRWLASHPQGACFIAAPHLGGGWHRVNFAVQPSGPDAAIVYVEGLINRASRGERW